MLQYEPHVTARGWCVAVGIAKQRSSEYKDIKHKLHPSLNERRADNDSQRRTSKLSEQGCLTTLALKMKHVKHNNETRTFESHAQALPEQPMLSQHMQPRHKRDEPGETICIHACSNRSPPM